MNRKKEKAVIILSGGLDSTTLLYDIIKQGYKVYALSFDYGQKHKIELIAAKKTCEKLDVEHTIVSLDVLNQVAPCALTRKDWDVPYGHYAEENMKQTVVSNRNMVLLSLATSFAISKGVKYLYYGAHKGDHFIYCDCRIEFVEAMKKAIKLCDMAEVELKAPYLNIDKGDIVIKGKKLGVDYNLTWTCYNPKENKACGKCGSCVERLEAFEKAGIKDPVSYKEQ